MPRYRPDLKFTARELRSHATKEEKRLWYDFLSKYPVRFLRQRPIGCYIVDFYCPSRKLAIELDGKQHQQPDAVEYDHERTKFLYSMGISVIRFRNDEVNNHFKYICGKIQELVPISPLPAGRGCPKGAGDV
ncbi:MAG: endonuclease domain-containing protein [Oscillospiraceae bacterium]|nr:endonuclease domain-containing protein [Oscillospiraceae bacterium]